MSRGQFQHFICKGRSQHPTRFPLGELPDPKHQQLPDDNAGTGKGQGCQDLEEMSTELGTGNEGCRASLTYFSSEQKEGLVELEE